MFDTPIVPVMTYDINNPPYVPDMLNVPQDTIRALPIVSAAIMNEAGLKSSSNPARMYCYNILVNNYWRNNNFSEIVELVIKLLYLNQYKGIYKYIEQGVSDAVSQVLTLYTSELIYKNDQLKSVCSPTLINAAMQNVGIFNNLKQELANMQYPPNQFNPNINQQPYPNQMYQQDPRFPQPYQQDPRFPQPYPNQMYQQDPRFPQPYPNQMYQQDPRFPQPYPSQQFPNQQQPNQNTSAFSQNDVNSGRQYSSDIHQGRFFRPSANTQTNINNQDTNAPVDFKTVNEVINDNTLIQGVTEMDRAKHRIEFFDKTYKTDTVKRYNDLNESTVRLNAISASDSEVNSYFVYPKWLFETNIETAILTSKVKQLVHQKKDSISNIYRCFTVAANPYVSIHDHSAYIKALQKSTNFPELANKIKHLSAALEMKLEEKEYTDSVINVLVKLDAILTAIVNDFLKNKINSTITIDSFCTDIIDLSSYLFKNNDSEIMTGYAVFEREVISSILEVANDEVTNSIKENLDIPDDLFVSFMPVNYSITNTFMTDKELGYTVGKDKLIVLKEEAPSLYRIIESLQKHKKMMIATTLYDILVTSDGVRYLLYCSYAGDDKFYIRKM